jgi:hypothetical protein
MNRVQKIKLLEGIKEGRLSKKVLTHPKSYVFTEKTDGELYYKIGEKRLSKLEYDHFCEEIDRDNNYLKSLGLKDLCCIIICIVIVEGKTIL